MATKFFSSESVIRRLRNSLGITPFRKHFDAKKLPQDTGSVPDSVIAERLGVTRGAVAKMRKKAGIESWKEASDGLPFFP